MRKLIIIVTAAVLGLACSKPDPVKPSVTKGAPASGGEIPAYINSGYYETDKPTDADSSLVGHCQSACPIAQCVYTVGKEQYVGFYDTWHRMVIAQRTVPNGPWKYMLMDEVVGWDSHNSITMARDPFGRILISGNMHAKPLVFFATDESADISTLRRIDHLVGIDEESVTYPKFLTLSDGRLLFHYRVGKSGDGNEIYDVLNSDGTWSRFIDTPLMDGQRLRNAYMLDPLQGPDGNYHLVWVWRETSDCATNHDLSYAYSPDLKHWFAPDGDAVELPITLDESRLILDPVPVKGGILNGGQKLSFDAQGRPMIVYYKYDENGYSQIYIARLENRSWNISKLTDKTFRWDFSGGGSIINKMSIGAAVQEETGEITVVYNMIPDDAAKINMEVWVDGTTLKPLREARPRSGAARYPSWVNTITTPYSGEGALLVNKMYDLSGAAYMLRWESLNKNNDVKPKVQIPPASELRVVRTYY